jgi:hypothetical protein
VIKERRNIALDYPEILLRLSGAKAYALDSIHRATVRSKPKGVLAEISFTDGFENHPESFLYNPIFNGRNSEWSELSIAFRNVDSPYRIWFKGFRL